MTQRLRPLLSLAAALLLAPLTAPAWDAAGHMLVGQIAWEKTNPAARAKVTELVAALEKTHNEGQTYNFITASCWMDDMRSQKGYPWGPWHYVTIQYTPTGIPAPIPAEGPHVVWAIGENLKTLRDPASPPAKQTEALAMLMHFVGDIHQPMHCTEWNDRGGNGYMITGVPFTDLMQKSWQNLHTLWDKSFRFSGRGGAVVQLWEAPEIAARPKAAGEGVIAQKAQEIMAAYPVEAMPELLAVMDAAAWARESHTIGCLAGYPPGPHPGNSSVVTIQPDFAERAGHLGQLRLALAGYRLAALFNQLYPAKK